MRTPRPRLMWALTRDGEIFDGATSGGAAVWRRREHAVALRNGFAPGSKHKWSICRVRVTPIKSKERRR